MPDTAADDYDSPWKGALENAFPEFVAFHFPDAHRQIDWARGHTFLDKELQQISHDAPAGRRHVDKLARVYRHDGSEDWVCIHIEVQGSRDADFAERSLFTTTASTTVTAVRWPVSQCWLTTTRDGGRTVSASSCSVAATA